MSFIRCLAMLALAAVLAEEAAASQQKYTYDDIELMKRANNKYASGELPLGDRRYVTEAPRKGYIFLCNVPNKDEGGAQQEGSWIHRASWNIFQKLAVQGKVTWSDASLTHAIEGDQRQLTGNGLPINHPTGLFPIQYNDPAALFDRNPNSIKAQSVRETLPMQPTYSDTPYCMGGEAGVMLTGVSLFNGFDAALRDAAAHELQDMCQGHPQKEGHYHYHSLSSCITDISIKTVIGYALDGFPITGPMVADKRYLTTDDLDECHGITSEIIEDGKKKITYHYVMTQDFPYSVSCFRGHPTRRGPHRTPIKAPQQSEEQKTQEQPSNNQRNQQMQKPQSKNQLPQPPREAIFACDNHADGTQCGFATKRGDMITGRCLRPPGQETLACVPNH
ncbi:MAG: YHYH protein [Alphaproteobacteria bacterium]